MYYILDLFVVKAGDFLTCLPPNICTRTQHVSRNM